jgi:ABC-type phosphate transport system auxiliary subunit
MIAELNKKSQAEMLAKRGELENMIKNLQAKLDSEIEAHGMTRSNFNILQESIKNIEN